MRIAVLSDIHANHLALQSVLEDAYRMGADRCWFLGDLIGYGPSPVEVLEWLMGRWNSPIKPVLWRMGNHDAMLADLILRGRSGATDALLSDRLNYPLPKNLTLPSDPPERIPKTPYQFTIYSRNADGKPVEPIIYRGEARGRFLKKPDWSEISGAVPLLALELNRLAMAKTPDVDDFWREEFIPGRELPVDITVDNIDFVLVHASLGSPLSRQLYAWHKEILLPKEVELLRSRGQGNCLQVELCGHTHVPMLVKAHLTPDGKLLKIDSEFVQADVEYPLGKGEKGTCSAAIVNPGSVGLPRDLDRRAAYALLDTKKRTVTYRRVPYDWQEVGYMLRKGYYPRPLRRRLQEAPPTGSTPPIWRKHYQRVRR